MLRVDGQHLLVFLVMAFYILVEEILRLWVNREIWWYYKFFYFFSKGGLALSLFVGAVIPLLFDKIARGLAPRIVTVAAFTYILQVVYAVWTSAYNFVPFGGTLTRETSHILVFFNFLGLYFGVYTASMKHWLLVVFSTRFLYL